MPKLKTNRGAKKRFKKTGSGGLKHRASNRAHLNSKMSSKRKRHLRKMSNVSKSDIKGLKQQLPFFK